MTALEALEEITRLSDIDIEDSSDTTMDFDEEEDEQHLLIDPIHDQEDAGRLPPLQLRSSLLLRVKMVQKKMRCISHLPVNNGLPQDP
ncbi:hypothetical protein AMECASPLE_038642 [Ameca splendens]|uniref:Uncharacterized protein n=1 Tax=Ameca splendens TaxID=208324 RepID=A0ABV0ZT06_9TELE